MSIEKYFMLDPIDQVQLNFSSESLWVLNIAIGFVMFGVALSLKVADFKRIFEAPKAPLVGLTSQLILLPALTFLLVYLLQPKPSLALGMILVAACPGGNLSNFFSYLAKGNAALSVSMTAVVTLLAVVTTPFNFGFWGSFYEPAAPLLQSVSIDLWDMFKAVLMLLAVPLSLGMWFNYQFPNLTQRIQNPIKWLSILIFFGFVLGAFIANFDLFLEYVWLVLWMVFIHNLVALLTGYGFARLFRLPNKDVRSITIETGIQNSGLGLLLIFNFFNGLGGMAIVAAWWGIWHIVSGMTIAFFWSKRT